MNIDLTDRIECALCDDRGYVTQHNGDGTVAWTEPCPSCNSQKTSAPDLTSVQT